MESKVCDNFRAAFIIIYRKYRNYWKPFSVKYGDAIRVVIPEHGSYVSGHTWPQDAAGGMLKRQADLAVLRGHARIQNAKDLFNYGAENLLSTKSTGCKRRVFRYIDSVSRGTAINYKPVPNIRAVHLVRVEHTSSPGCISVNDLSCFTCDKCVYEQYDACLNISKTGKSRSVTMKQEISDVRVNDLHADLDDLCNEPMKNIVAANQVIAVFADDPILDYFLLFVQTSIHTLEKDTTDAWGTTLASGTDVFSGLYYDQIRGNPLEYRRIPKKIAIVPADSVVYICSELHVKPTIVLPEHVHLDILACVDFRRG